MTSKRLHVVIALLVGVGIFAAAYHLQTALVAAGLLKNVNVTVVADALLGGLAASCLLLLLRHLESRREQLRRQLYDAVSADLNHHIRNALQLILNQAEMLEVHRFSEFQDIREAVSRIDWALREILPRGYESPRQNLSPYSRPPSRRSHKLLLYRGEASRPGGREPLKRQAAGESCRQPSAEPGGKGG
jgi:phosphate/sulfate permease